MRPQATEVKGKINGVPTCLQSTIKTGEDHFPTLKVKNDTKDEFHGTVALAHCWNPMTLETIVWNTEE